MRHALALALVTTLAGRGEWATAVWANDPEAASLSFSMFIASVVLVATPVILIGIAVVWFVASQHRTESEGRRSSRLFER